MGAQIIFTKSGCGLIQSMGNVTLARQTLFSLCTHYTSAVQTGGLLGLTGAMVCVVKKYDFNTAQFNIVANTLLILFPIEVGRCRYFASVSVFGFLIGFYKNRFGIRYRFLKISDIGSVFRLSNPCL